MADVVANVVADVADVADVVANVVADVVANVVADVVANVVANVADVANVAANVVVSEATTDLLQKYNRVLYILNACNITCNTMADLDGLLVCREMCINNEKYNQLRTD